MKTTETTKVLTPKEKRIAKVIAESEAKLKLDIAEIENEEEAKEARKELEKKIKELIREFEFTYNVKYKIDDTPSESKEQKKLTIEEKYELAKAELNKENQLKYRMNDTKDAIIGAKGEPITSVIKMRVDGKIETLSVRNFFEHLKPEATKEELDKLYPNKK
ncbi:hypothetical protein [Flavobacterium aquicola]|uniref:Uncharacterized protein n=1 Tax=Flavobacterium aquicola TaxID=1682742 RepID=A0A3E0ES01_9FLAO|nr:hypothetical protein [Flavobacterium aquicola]REH00906.1 hypothetical protein C8P67_102158 [Flavobacterium aquicola]